MRGEVVLALLVSTLIGCGDDLAAGGGGSPGAGGAAGGAGGEIATGAGGDGGAALPVPGLRAEYFAAYEDLVLERIEQTLDQIWGADGPSAEVGVDRFSARWTGSLLPVETGTYTLTTETDDGVRLWLDGVLLIDDWNGHFVTSNSAVVELVAGQPAELRIDYFEIDLEASARLSWTRPGQATAELVPAASLVSAPEPGGLPAPKPPYQNPVMAFDCPDPGVVRASTAPLGYAAVCTGGTFPIRTSSNLIFWQDSGAAVLPGGKPSWAANGNRNWAPELHLVGGVFVAYFTSVNGADVLSIGAASSAELLGPYQDIGAPLVQNGQGVIDATFFEDDDGSRWLLDKVDGNATGNPTPIRLRQLAGDGLSFAAGSSTTTLLVNDGSTWEGGVIEAPWVVKRDGLYYLFYSGNVYDHRYRTGVARASALAGPYEKHGAPILINNERWVGPGHGSVVDVGGDDHFVYHAWTNAGDGTHLASAGRHVLVDRIVWQDGWPVIHDGSPSRTPQPWPGAD